MSDVAIVWTIGLAVVAVFALLYGRAAVQALRELHTDVKAIGSNRLDCGCTDEGVRYGCLVCGFTRCVEHRHDGHDCNAKLGAS